MANKHRYGPPPSYPQLKIPGLNAPIPLGPLLVIDQGRPPVNEHGRPIYGDVFGVLQQDEPNYDQTLGRFGGRGGGGRTEEVEEEELMVDEEMEDGTQSVDTISRGRSQRSRQNVHCTRFLNRRKRGSPWDTIWIKSYVDLLKNPKSDKVDVTIQPEELEVMDDVRADKARLK
ncbi:unnamed protein product [Urochloa humidicola]